MCVDDVDDRKGFDDGVNFKVCSVNCEDDGLNGEDDGLDGEFDGVNGEVDNVKGKGDGVNCKVNGVNGVIDGVIGVGDGVNGEVVDKYKGLDDEDGILIILFIDIGYSIIINDDEKVVLKMLFKKEI